MTVLSDKQIRERRDRDVRIWPYRPENVNTSSYDVTLGQFFYQERKPKIRERIFGSVFNIWDHEDTNRIWEGPLEAMSLGWWNRYGSYWPWKYKSNYKGIRNEDLVIFIPPKSSILAHTNEFIGGRTAVTTEMRARSSYGRVFIQVCACAGWGDVGYTNRWTMEIYNRSRYYHIPLVVGRRIAQIIFHETGPVQGKDYSQEGKYQRNHEPEKEPGRWHPMDMLPRLYQDREIQERARER